MKLLVRNLSRTTSEASLQEMFTRFGRVQSCSLVLDKATGQSKGFAFVTMPNPGEAKAAMKSLNGTEQEGSKIRVKRAAPRPGTAPESEPVAEA